MKVSYFFIAALLLFFSCASSQNSVSPDTKRKIEELRSFIHLSSEQTKKITLIESNYLDKVKQLNQKQKNNDADLIKLQQKRKSAYKKTLNREQFVKFQAIENNLVKEVPVRF